MMGGSLVGFFIVGGFLVAWLAAWLAGDHHGSAYAIWHGKGVKEKSKLLMDLDGCAMVCRLRCSRPLLSEAASRSQEARRSSSDCSRSGQDSSCTWYLFGPNIKHLIDGDGRHQNTKTLTMITASNCIKYRPQRVIACHRSRAVTPPCYAVTSPASFPSL